MGEKKDNEGGEKPRSDKQTYKTITATAVVATPHDTGIPELAGHVYIVGPGQADRFRKTTEALAEYAGRNFMEEMHDLVLNGAEATFPEPPDLPDDQAKGAKLEKYKIQLKMALDEEKKYKSDKARVFRLIMGQCVPLMRSKLENEPTFKTLEQNKDVAGLMKLMKSLVYSTTSHQYEFWTMQASLTTLLTLKQHEKEGIATFGKRFLAQLEATELVWGKLIPTKYSAKTDDEKTKAMHKFLACVLLAGVDRGRYKAVIDELNNDYLLGSTTFPEDVPNMLNLIANYRGGRGSNPKTEAMLDGVVMNQAEHGKCTNCGSTKHKWDGCPRRKKDDKDRKKDKDDEDEEDDEQQNMAQAIDHSAAWYM
jgi:hypothetical protein